MIELQKKKLEGGGGAPPKRKLKLVKGTKFVSLLFIGASILISAGFMRAANVYYDLDTNKIVMSEALDLNVSVNQNTNINTGTSTGTVTIGNSTVSNLVLNDADWSVTGAGAGDFASLTVDGTMGIRETTGSTYYTYLQGGDQTANLTLTLPNAYAAVSGYVLSSTNAGVLSWVAASQGTVMDVGSQQDVSLAFGDSTASGHWLGLGNGVAEPEYTGRIAFQGNLSGATDYVNILGANLGIGTTAPAELLSVGLAGTTKGVMSLAGNTSGKVIIQPLAAAGNYTLTLPPNDGNLNSVLVTDGNGVLTWADATAASAHELLGGPTVHTNTALSPVTRGGIITGKGASTVWDQLSAGAAGSFLTANGAGADLTWGNTATTLALTSTGSLTVGTSDGAGEAKGQVIFKNVTNAFTQTVEGNAAVDASYVYTLPATKGGTFAMTSDVASVGTGVLRGQINIFGFDYPTQCATSCDGGEYQVISRTIEDMTSVFPTVLSGKTRQYRLAIRYDDDTAGNVTWQIYRTTGAGSPVGIFTFNTAGSDDNDLTKGKIIVSPDLTLPTTITDDWVVRVTTTSIGDSVRVYSIDLAAYDVD